MLPLRFLPILVLACCLLADSAAADATFAKIRDSWSSYRTSAFNWFDTAEMYGGGRSEQELSHALHAAGKEDGEVVVATNLVNALRVHRPDEYGEQEQQPYGLIGPVTIEAS